MGNEVALENRTRVGITRPDLQFDYDDRRYHVEYNSPTSGRGPAHQARLLDQATEALDVLLLHWMNFFLQKALLASAKLLGREKHTLALECIQQKLHELRPKGFSLNQRYKENKATGRWEPLSEQQVKALLRNGGDGLIGTIVPDIVIHTGNPVEVLDILDLKFPCPGTNAPTWHRYPDGHPFARQSQGQVYKRAFGIDPARVAPRWDIQRSLPK